MEKTWLTPAASASLQATLPGFTPAAESGGRSARSLPPVERERARQACAPMGVLVSVAVTVDARNRRRTWYVIEPDQALAAHYVAHGLDVTRGGKVLLDAETMRPVAIIDIDSDAAAAEAPTPLGFNPYWDLPPT
jgi:hypothetical protein